MQAMKKAGCQGTNGLKGYWWVYKLYLNSCKIDQIIDLGTTFSVVAGVLTAISAKFIEKRVAFILGVVTAIVALGTYALTRCSKAAKGVILYSIFYGTRGLVQEPVRKAEPMSASTTWRAMGWLERACAVLLVLVALAAIVTYLTALDTPGKAAQQVAPLAILALVATVGMTTAHRGREAKQRP